MNKKDFLTEIKKLNIKQINNLIETKGKKKLIPLFVNINNEEEK